jgi:hypothetical protein
MGARRLCSRSRVLPTGACLDHARSAERPSMSSTSTPHRLRPADRRAPLRVCLGRSACRSTRHCHRDCASNRSERVIGLSPTWSLSTARPKAERLQSGTLRSTKRSPLHSSRASHLTDDRIILCPLDGCSHPHRANSDPLTTTTVAPRMRVVREEEARSK